MLLYGNTVQPRARSIYLRNVLVVHRFSLSTFTVRVLYLLHIIVLALGIRLAVGFGFLNSLVSILFTLLFFFSLLIRRTKYVCVTVHRIAAITSRDRGVRIRTTQQDSFRKRLHFRTDYTKLYVCVYTHIYITFGIIITASPSFVNDRSG